MSEARTIVRHAATVLGGQLAVIAFGVVDTLVAARHSETALATLAVGSAVYIGVFVSLNAVLQALIAEWSRHHGAGQPRRLGHSFHQSLYLWLLLSVLGVAALAHPHPLMALARVPHELQLATAEYLMLLAPALPIAMLFRLFATLNQSMGRPRPVALLQLGGLLLKIPLTIWWVHGGAGLPALGVAGCGWSTLVVAALMLVLALALLRAGPAYRPLALWSWPAPPHLPTLRQLARIGVPAGLAVSLDVTAFSAMALLIARQGAEAAAAHQVAASLAAVLFMVPLSLAIATSARVGARLGAGDAPGASGCAWLGVGITLSAAVLSAGVLVVLRDPLAQVYAAENAAVAARASALLPWVAAYHVGDALTTVSAFALRCWRVVIAPLAIAALLLWGVGIAGGHHLAYRGLAGMPAWQSPTALWAASALAMGLAAFALTTLLWSVAHRPRPPHRHSA